MLRQSAFAKATADGAQDDTREAWPCETIHGDGAPWLQEAYGSDGRRGRLPYNPDGGREARLELGIR